MEALLGYEMVQVACGASHVLAVSNEREVFAWGRGDNGKSCLLCKTGLVLPLLPPPRWPCLPTDVPAKVGGEQLQLLQRIPGPLCFGFQSLLWRWGPGRALAVAASMRLLVGLCSGGVLPSAVPALFLLPGRLGLGTLECHNSPQQVPVPPEHEAHRVICGIDSSMVLTTKNQILACGSNR